MNFLFLEILRKKCNRDTEKQPRGFKFRISKIWGIDQITEFTSEYDNGDWIAVLNLLYEKIYRALMSDTA